MSSFGFEQRAHGNGTARDIVNGPAMEQSLELIPRVLAVVHSDPRTSPQEQQSTESAQLLVTDTSEHNHKNEIPYRAKPLKDEHLVVLSNLITNEAELRTLGTIGLKLPLTTIQSAVNDSRRIANAGITVLLEWQRQYEDPVVAFNDLITALRKCGMKKLALELVAIARKRHSTDTEAATSASPRDASPTNDSSHQQAAIQTASVQPELNSDEMTNVTEPLNDRHLLKLSGLITSPTDLRKLGIEGLKLSANKIQSALTNNPGDIQEAALSVLSDWKKSYLDRSAAFRDLVTALRKCGMNQLVSKLLENVYTG